MEGIKINIDAEAVNQYVAKAIIESSIGKALEAEINKAVSNMSSSFNNPYKPVIEREVLNAVQKLLREKYATQIEEHVKELVSQEAVKRAVDTIWDKMKYNL